MKWIKKMPLATSGLALSLAALGNLLRPYGEWIRYVCGVLSAVILCLYIIKWVLDFKQVKEELKNPVVLSILPTATMALMLLCAYVKPFIGIAAVWLGYAAIILHVLIMLYFTKCFVLSFKLQTVFPSWFVAGVGIVAASVVSPALEARWLGQIIFYIGFVLYFVILLLVIYRMVKLKPLPEPARPTLAIFTAPMSLCLTGYLSAFEQPQALFVYIMLGITLISYIYVSVNMIYLLRLKFYPTYAAFTFPYVISAVAVKSANAFLVNNGYHFFSFVPKIFEWAAVLVVVYVLFRYLAFMAATPRPQ